MTLYRYKAISAAGDTLQGEMEATSKNEVVFKLQQAGNIPVSAEEASSSGAFSLLNFFSSRNTPSQHDVGVFTQQMATLLEAGLPLDRSLQVLLELAENDKIARLVSSVRDQVREGASLSSALEVQHGVFSKLYINMVRAGEAGGTIEQSLQRLADYLERSKALKSSVVSALIYPIILLLLAGASLIVLLMVVVPKFAPIFEELGADMPLLTKIVLGVGYVLQNWWFVLIAIGFGVYYFMKKQLSDPTTRYQWHQRFLKLKFVGDLITKMEMARLARTLGTLLVNGVPVLGALSIAKNVMNNSVMIEGVEDSAEEVKKGGALAHTLSNSPYFPKLAIQMISVGEETGHLDSMLLKVADAYDIEVKTTIDRLLSLFVPLLTVVLALIIGMIVMSILMAILSVNELIA